MRAHIEAVCVVGAGDEITVVDRPAHGVTAGTAFRALTTEQHRLPELTPALAALPLKNRPKISAKITAKIAARTGATV